MIAACAGAMERLTQLTASDVMSREVAAIPLTATIEEAAELLAARGASGAPVVNGSGRCVGVVSATDFLRLAAAKHAVTRAQPPSGHGSTRAHALCVEAAHQAVATIMTAPPRMIPVDAPLTSVIDQMCSMHIHRLVVVDESGAPRGVVSTLDVVAALGAAIEEQEHVDRAHA